MKARQFGFAPYGRIDVVNDHVNRLAYGGETTSFESFTLHAPHLGLLGAGHETIATSGGLKDDLGNAQDSMVGKWI